MWLKSAGSMHRIRTAKSYTRRSDMSRTVTVSRSSWRARAIVCAGHPTLWHAAHWRETRVIRADSRGGVRSRRACPQPQSLESARISAPKAALLKHARACGDEATHRSAAETSAVSLRCVDTLRDRRGRSIRSQEHMRSKYCRIGAASSRTDVQGLRSPRTSRANPERARAVADAKGPPPVGAPSAPRCSCSHHVAIRVSPSM